MSDNSEQISEWNGALGERWAERQVEIDRMIGPLGEAAIRAADARAGERILDIGCGTGATSLVLASAVGAQGKVLGVDISRPMLDLARRRGAGMTQLEFAEADASSAELPTNFDLIFSRFGVMFFDQPSAAFAHMRCALKPDGRLAFTCWRAPRENAWAMTPLSAARKALQLEQPPSDPLAPGPFAFADATRIQDILSTAGFSDVAVTPFEAPVYLGSTPRSAAEGASQMGPLSRFIRFAGADRAGEAIDAVTEALAPFASPEGVRLPGAVWIVTARSPARP